MLHLLPRHLDHNQDALRFPTTMQPHCQFLRTVALAALVGLTLPVYAALGGDQASVIQDQGTFGATMRQEMLAGYSLYTLTTGDGVHIRQYVSAGQVFAVAWDGPVLPDMETLLGTHFDAYALAQRQKGRGLRVQQPHLVIESGGMMRAFRGRAFLPERLPSTVGARDIQ